MWTDEKQRLFDLLREKKYAGVLTDDEKQQLDSLFSEIEAEEEQLLAPAMERADKRIAELQKECDEKEARNIELASLAAKQQELLTHARAYLSTLLSEQAIINAERERLLGKTARLG
ncbi:MAG: hypothetical protein ACREEM_44275 [Blastocatellia bacterium]